MSSSDRDDRPLHARDGDTCPPHKHSASSPPSSAFTGGKITLQRAHDARPSRAYLGLGSHRTMKRTSKLTRPLSPAAAPSNALDRPHPMQRNAGAHGPSGDGAAMPSSPGAHASATVRRTRGVGSKPASKSSRNHQVEEHSSPFPGVRLRTDTLLRVMSDNDITHHNMKAPSSPLDEPFDPLRRISLHQSMESSQPPSKDETSKEVPAPTTTKTLKMWERMEKDLQTHVSSEKNKKQRWGRNKNSRASRKRSHRVRRVAHHHKNDPIDARPSTSPPASLGMRIPHPQQNHLWVKRGKDAAYLSKSPPARMPHHPYTIHPRHQHHHDDDEEEEEEESHVTRDKQQQHVLKNADRYIASASPAMHGAGASSSKFTLSAHNIPTVDILEYKEKARKMYLKQQAEEQHQLMMKKKQSHPNAAPYLESALSGLIGTKTVAIPLPDEGEHAYDTAVLSKLIEEAMGREKAIENTRRRPTEFIPIPHHGPSKVQRLPSDLGRDGWCLGERESAISRGIPRVVDKGPPSSSTWEGVKDHYSALPDLLDEVLGDLDTDEDRAAPRPSHRVGGHYQALPMLSHAPEDQREGEAKHPQMRVEAHVQGSDGGKRSLENTANARAHPPNASVDDGDAMVKHVPPSAGDEDRCAFPQQSRPHRCADESLEDGVGCCESLEDGVGSGEPLEREGADVPRGGVASLHTRHGQALPPYGDKEAHEAVRMLLRNAMGGRDLRDGSDGSMPSWMEDYVVTEEEDGAMAHQHTSASSSMMSARALGASDDVSSMKKSDVRNEGDSSLGASDDVSSMKKSAACNEGDSSLRASASKLVFDPPNHHSHVHRASKDAMMEATPQEERGVKHAVDDDGGGGDGNGDLDDANQSHIDEMAVLLLNGLGHVESDVPHRHRHDTPSQWQTQLLVTGTEESFASLLEEEDESSTSPLHQRGESLYGDMEQRLDALFAEQWDV